MNIAILSLPQRGNYGGVLQSYALCNVLTRIGHNAELLQYAPRKTFVQNLPIYIKRAGHKLLKDWNTSITDKAQAKRDDRYFSEIDRFMASNIWQRCISSFSEIGSGDYDAIVVGSDQVWRRNYFCGSWGCDMANAFLSFTGGWNIRRVAYAASFGKDSLDEYSQDEIKRCSAALKEFDAVSVREESGRNCCMRLGCQSAIKVCDPTILLKREDYESIVASSDTKPFNGGLFVYMLDPNEPKNRVVGQIEAKTGLKNYTVASSASEKDIKPGLEKWLRAFMDAEVIVTDSFHGCVFSIIFGKPFVPIVNARRGLSRFTSLMEMFGLEEILVTDPQSFVFAQLPDMTGIQVRIDEIRSKGLEFLKACI